MSFEDITIIIPTVGRINKQETLSILSPALLERTILSVDQSEYHDHNFKYGRTCKVKAIPYHMKGIAKIRQHHVETCKTPYLFLLDDDMVFFKRIPDSIKLEKCNDPQLEFMFSILTDWMFYDDLPLVGVSARQGNNHVKEIYKDATRQMNFHGIDIDRFKQLGLRFDGLEVMEDFNLVLNLLIQGIPNRVFYKYCWNQLGSGAVGGCSSYRTGELQKQCAETLQKRFPEFVKTVEKKSKSGWEGLETRTDVRVQWKKAYDYGRKLNETNNW